MKQQEDISAQVQKRIGRNDLILLRSVGDILAANQYVLICNNHALVIDACADPEGALPDGVVLDAIILTHEHYDHICCANEWALCYGASIWCGRAAASGIANPRMNMSHYGSALFETIARGERVDAEIKDYVCVPDRTFSDRDRFSWQGYELEFIETPGHSPGSVCLLIDGTLLFCGDTMLAEEATGVRFRGADKSLLYESTFPKLHALADGTMVYPGHGKAFLLKDYRFWEETT